MKLYVATTNPGKLRDFAAAAGQHTTLEPLPELANIPAPPEDAPTFQGNAEEKAIYYSHHAPGHVILSDDSGLEVYALSGAPGVRSARYADDSGYLASASDSTDARNNACLLHALAEIPEGQRHARYRCVLAAARDGKIIQTADGTVEGEILLAPRGTSGFGYDPFFFLPQLKKTMAELDATTKLAFSHRGNALRSLLVALTHASVS